MNIYKKSDIPEHLQKYFEPAELGLEQTPEEYIAAMVEVFRCVRDVLADDGTLWLNIGDSYGRGKQLHGIPWRVALALQSDGWVLRQDIIWHKPNPMPSAVTDRCVTAHEYLFLLAKREKYFFDHVVLQEPAKYGEHHAKYQGTYARHKVNVLQNDGAVNGSNYQRGLAGRSKDPTKRNRRGVWSIPVFSYSGAHFAVMPPALVEPCILAGSRPGDIVLDPFMGSGTTAAVALKHGRQYLGCELNPEYGPLQQQRISQVAPNVVRAAETNNALSRLLSAMRGFSMQTESTNGGGEDEL